MGPSAQDVKWGLKWGTGFAVGMTIYTIGLYLAVGSEPFDRVGLRPPVVLALYIIGSLAAGLIVGFLRKLTATRDGSMLVGTVAALPASFAMGLAFFGAPSAWSAGDWVQCIFMAILFGAGLGYL
jgi:hypothetical protein